MFFDTIRESHDLQRDLCRKLTASRGDMAARQALASRFWTHLCSPEPDPPSAQLSVAAR